MNINQPCLFYSFFIGSARVDDIQKIVSDLKFKFEFRSIAPLNPTTITEEKLANPGKILPVGTFSGQNVLLNVGIIHNKTIFAFLFSSSIECEIESAKQFWTQKLELMTQVSAEIKKKFQSVYLGDCISFISFGDRPDQVILSIKEMLGYEKDISTTFQSGTMAEFFEEGQEFHFFVISANNEKKALTIQTIFRNIPVVFCFVVELEKSLARLRAILPELQALPGEIDNLTKKASTDSKGPGQFEIGPMGELLSKIEKLSTLARVSTEVEEIFQSRFDILQSNIEKNFKPGKSSPLFKHYIGLFSRQWEDLKKINPTVKTTLEKAYSSVHTSLFRKKPGGAEIIAFTLLKTLKAGSLSDGDRLAIQEMIRMFDIDQESLASLIGIAKSLTSENSLFNVEQLEKDPQYRESLKNAFLERSLSGHFEEVKDLFLRTFPFSENEIRDIFAALLENARKKGGTPLDSTPAGQKDPLSFQTAKPRTSPAFPGAEGEDDSRGIGYATIPARKPVSRLASPPPSTRADDDDEIPLLGAAKSKPSSSSSEVKNLATPPPKRMESSARRTPPPTAATDGAGPGGDGYFGSGVFTITPDYFFDLAKEVLKKQQFQGAKDLLKRACQLDPNHMKSRLYLGITYLKLGEIDKGLQNCEAALKEEPLKNEAAFFMGYGHLLKKDPREAEKFFSSCDMPKIEIEYLTEVVHLFNEAGKPQRGEQICEQILTPEKLAERFPVRYADIKVLGAGGMGVVYRATDTTLAIPVALKLIRPEWAKDKDLLESMLREAQLMAKVGKHPNIISIFDIQREGIPYIIMEFIRGRDLRHYINENKAIPHDQILKVVLQALDGLAFVHDVEPPIIHRDIKPENIMLDEKMNAHIMDLGLAEFGKKSEDTPDVVGTPAYMSPEQWQGLQIDPRTDIYAVGIFMYEMVTGELPFMGTFFRKIIAEADPPKKYKPNIPEDWENFIVKCIRKNREERFKDAHEALAALAKLKPFE